ncbi:MAG: hypothetical protein KJO11_05285, partial [Gemmatimonadetes bacterium]|nr:hypothetical protein [Gemmatimonadota bacterium]
MKPDSELEPLTGLPPELADLDAELARFQAEERSSFAPELEAELAHEWIRGPRWSLGERARRAAAAAVIGLTLTGLAVPPARASIVDGLQRLIGALQDAEEQGATPAEPAVPVSTVSTPVAEPGVRPLPVS